MSVFSDFGITQGDFTALIFLYSGLIFLLSAISVVLFCLRGYGIYKMSRKLEIKGKWKGFVPILRVTALGRLADGAAVNNKSNQKKCITAFYLLFLLFAAATFTAVVSPSVELLFEADIAVKNGNALDSDIFYGFTTAFIIGLAALVLYLIYRITALACCYKIYKKFCRKNAVAFTVLSVIFPFLMSCFIYTACKNDPENEKNNPENEDTVTGFEIYNEQ